MKRLQSIKKGQDKKMKELILKRKMLIIPLLLAVGIIGTASAFSLITANTSILTNHITVGEVTTKINDETDEEEVVEAGATLKKVVSVTNTDSEEGAEDAVTAFVRVRVTVTPADSLAYEPLEDSSEKVVILCKRAAETEEAVILGVEENKSYGDWIYHDGYYYYSRPLAADETTSPLFEAVSIGKRCSQNFDITVYQEAVNYHAYASLFYKTEVGGYSYQGGEVNGVVYNESNKTDAMQEAFDAVTKK